METLGSRTNATINKAAEDFHKLRAEGVIDDNLFFKCMVGLAYEYTENQESESAAKLIFTCPPSYYKDVLPKQIKEDRQYRDCVIRLAYNMYRAGYFEFQKDPLEFITPTAKA